MTERLFERLTESSGVYFDATLVERRRTPFQLLEVYDSPDLGRLFRLDGCNMTSERDEFFYHENLVHPAAIAHPGPASALVIGGGDGGSSKELLRHGTMRKVRMAELDPEVIAEAGSRFGAVHGGAFDDPRLEVAVGDGLAWLRETRERYDLVAMDLTDPVGPSTDLYTPATFALAKGVLADGGAMVLHLGSPFSHPGRVKSTLANLRSVFPLVTPYFVHVPAYGALWGFACASESLDPREVEPTEAESRLASRGISGLRYYNGDTHRAVFALPNFVKSLLA